VPQFITPDGIKLNFEMAGSGKPLLFLHGWAMCSRVWKYQLKWFAGDYKVIALDLRGHGRSESPDGDYNLLSLSKDIIYFIEGLQLERLTLVGWSLAVSLILKLFSFHPLRVDSLVLVDGTPAFMANGGFPHGLPYPVVKRMLKLINSNFAQALKVFYHLLLSKAERELENKDEIWELLTNENYLPKPQIAHKLLLSLAYEDLRCEMRNITVPTLIMHGSEDKICPQGAAQYMREHLKNGELALFPAAGHAPFLTQHRIFNKRLTYFLNLL